ncbi:8971_t:CDS:2, partial [Funneliformis geosporum]
LFGGSHHYETAGSDARPGVDIQISQTAITEVGNFIYPSLSAKGFFAGYDMTDGHRLHTITPLPVNLGTESIFNEKFIFRKDTGHSSHYLYKHCYLTIRSLGDEIAKIGQLCKVGEED